MPLIGAAIGLALLAFFIWGVVSVAREREYKEEAPLYRDPRDDI